MENRNLKGLSVCVLVALTVAACGGGGGGGAGGGSGGDGSGGGDAAGGKKLLSRVLTEGVEDRTFQYDSQNRLITDSALGVGNKIEYEGDDSRPALVTGTADICDYASLVSGAYTEYRYGEDSLLNGVPTRYYQTRTLDQNKKPCTDLNVFLQTFSYPRYYLNSDDRLIDDGLAFGPANDPFYGSDVFYPSGGESLAYDDNGNLVEKKIHPVGVFTGGPTIITCEYTYDDKKNPASGMATPQWWLWRGYGEEWDWSDSLGQLLSNTNNPLSSVCSGRTYANIVSNEIHYSYTYDQDGYPTAVDVTITLRFDSPGGFGTTTENYKRTFEYIAAH
ncbi:MAG: hypothetical protein FWF41_06845 [Betaproteobacteria bacterium]|nr:hypothetical protein [Betaproteobacteria bacterium]